MRQLLFLLNGIKALWSWLERIPVVYRPAKLSFEYRLVPEPQLKVHVFPI